MRTLRINRRSHSCEVRVGCDVSDLVNMIKGRRMIIVTDRNVQELYGNRFTSANVIEIGIGEKAKIPGTVMKVIEGLMNLEVDRSNIIIGLGGGVVCDVTGYVCATYLNGMNYVLVPTTLDAMVDVQVGGRCGINFGGVKDLIGAFHQPDFIIIDLDFLDTLPREELPNGFALMIKLAAIRDRELFLHLEDHVSEIRSLKKEDIEYVIYSGLSLKGQLVEMDEKNPGERVALDLGHTFGHAIESVYGLPHGKATGIGLILAARLSRKRGWLGQEELNRLTALVGSYDLPTTFKLDAVRMLDAIKRDKKRQGHQLSFVLLNHIGRTKIELVPLHDVETLLKS